MHTDDIELLEAHITECEKRIKRADALERLRNNPDFVEIFEEHYLKEQAAYWAIALGSKSYAYADAETCIARITGIGQFNEFMVSIQKFADRSHQDIAEARAQIVAIESLNEENE